MSLRSSLSPSQSGCNKAHYSLYGFLLYSFFHFYPTGKHFHLWIRGSLQYLPGDSTGAFLFLRPPFNSCSKDASAESESDNSSRLTPDDSLSFLILAPTVSKSNIIVKNENWKSPTMPPYMYDQTNDSQFHSFVQRFKVSRYHFCWSDYGYMFARHQTWENLTWEVCNQWSSGVMRWWWTYKWLRTRLFIARVWEIWWRLKWHLQAKTLLSTYLLFTEFFC